MKRIPSRLFLLSVVAGLSASLSLSAQPYHDAAAFGLKGPVKECQLISEADDPLPFQKVSFTKDGRLEKMEGESSSPEGCARRISDIVRSGDMLTGFRYTYEHDGDKAQYDFRFRYKDGNLLGCYKQIKTEYAYIGLSEACQVYTFSQKGDGSFHKGFFAAAGVRSERFLPLIEDGFKKSGDLLPSLASFAKNELGMDDDDYRLFSADYVIENRDSQGNYTLIKESGKGYSIKRIITYWEEPSEQPAQTTSISSYSNPRYSPSSASSSRSSARSKYRYRGGRTRSYHKPWFTIGVDASLDYIISETPATMTTYYDPYYGDYYTDYEEGEDRMAYGAGLCARIGRPDQMFNLIGGARYTFGDMKGLQVPVLLNWNLYRGDYGSTYIGGGYAFGMTEMYKGTGCTIIQLGIGIPHFDCRFYYKPEQNVLGLGMTVYL